MKNKGKSVLVVAPHPDDETLGCGGTLLRHASEGDSVHWLILTRAAERLGHSKSQIQKRQSEIAAVAKKYGCASVTQLDFAPTQLDTIPLSGLIRRIGECVRKIKPQIVYLPCKDDVHSDHRVAFDAVMACTKTFRNPFVKRILSYETLSETDHQLDPNAFGFRPNVFVDISRHARKKMEILKLYKSEMGVFPFPRSERAVRALMELRGSASNCEAAEAFMLLKEIS